MIGTLLNYNVPITTSLKIPFNMLMRGYKQDIQNELEWENVCVFVFVSVSVHCTCICVWLCPIEWEGIEPFACVGLFSTKAFANQTISCNMPTPFAWQCWADENKDVLGCGYAPTYNNYFIELLNICLFVFCSRSIATIIHYQRVLLLTKNTVYLLDLFVCLFVIFCLFLCLLVCLFAA